MSGWRTAGGPVIPNFGRGSACLRNNHWFCPSWVREHWSDILQPALVQHIYLTLIAVSIGFAISFVLALLAFRFRYLGLPLGALGDFLYCLPSIALFTILLPITGITVTTIVLPLIAYTLFVLYPNILTGLRGVPPGGARVRAGDGADAQTDLLARGVAVRGAGDHGRAAGRDGGHDRNRHGRGRFSSTTASEPRSSTHSSSRTSSGRSWSPRGLSRSCSRSAPTRCSRSSNAPSTPWSRIR